MNRNIYFVKFIFDLKKKQIQLGVERRRRPNPKDK